MAQTFDQIPSEVDILQEAPKKLTVAEEIQCSQQLLKLRIQNCKKIPTLISAPAAASGGKRKTPRGMPLHYTYKYVCVCPRYAPSYKCKHAGNVIIDRDVLTKEEHICYLATPKPNYAAPRKQPRFYAKRVVMPNCTPRIYELSRPNEARIKENVERYGHCMPRSFIDKMKTHFKNPNKIEFTTISTALNFIEEEQRLKRVARQREKRRCKRMKKNIVLKQRRQIRKIVCVLFEEMKDFLLNDQFLIDEQSPLCQVILEQIREFTDKEFYTTSNLREYQHILANNLAVWINKFISNLNIHVAPPTQSGETRIERPEQEAFLPVSDYISCSDQIPEEEEGLTDGFPASGEEFVFEYGTEETMK